MSVRVPCSVGVAVAPHLAGSHTEPRPPRGFQAGVKYIYKTDNGVPRLLNTIRKRIRTYNPRFGLKALWRTTKNASRLCAPGQLGPYTILPVKTPGLTTATSRQTRATRPATRHSVIIIPPPPLAVSPVTDRHDGPARCPSASARVCDTPYAIGRRWLSCPWAYITVPCSRLTVVFAPPPLPRSLQVSDPTY